MTTQTQNETPNQTPNQSPDHSASRTTIWRYGLIGAGVAAAMNLMLFALSSAAGVSYLLRRSADADPSDVTAAHVALMTLIPFIVGVAIAAAAARRLRHGLRIVQVVGVVVALLSVGGPLGLEADIAARLTLAAMHLIPGVCLAVALGRVRNA